MRPVVQTLIALAVLGMLGAGAVIAFGLYNVSARAGHLSVVEWALHTTYDNAVRLRAPPESEVPDDLDDPDRIALGAQHYDTACAGCHGPFPVARNATTAALEPQPPVIRDALEGWEPRHLHWIVNQGVKMSGMPHWPAEGRGDEVWSIVAFLVALRTESMDYAALTEDEGGTCAACHGAEGGTGSAFVPRLDIQTPEYLALSLAAYRDGARQSGFMAEVASGLTDAEIAALSRELGSVSGESEAVAEDSAGALLARRGTDEVPACTACHGPGAPEASAEIPVLAGQNRHYLATQLRLWREGSRGGGARAELMAAAARALTDEDIALLADWYAGLDPAPF